MIKVTTKNLKDMMISNMTSSSDIDRQAIQEHWPDNGRLTFTEFILDVRNKINSSIDKYGPILEEQFKEWNKKYADE